MKGNKLFYESPVTEVWEIRIKNTLLGQSEEFEAKRSGYGNAETYEW